MSASPQSDLVIRNLTKRFVVNADEVTALGGIQLDVREGELVVIVGASGCGKSTLLRIIAGLDVGYEGSVELGGKPIRKPGRDRGMVFQDHRLFPWFTVRQNIEFALEDGSAAARAGVVKDHIALVGLGGFENAFPHQLSGGMAQRAAIARALVNRPRVLLLDEPFGALDALTRIQMQQELLRIREADKTTMILVTHDIDEAIYLGDRVHVMSSRPGKIQKTVPVNLYRPRDRTSADFTRLRKEIHAEFFAKTESPWGYAI